MLGRNIILFNNYQTAVAVTSKHGWEIRRGGKNGEGTCWTLIATKLELFFFALRYIANNVTFKNITPINNQNYLDSLAFILKF